MPSFSGTETADWTPRKCEHKSKVGRMLITSLLHHYENSKKLTLLHIIMHSAGDSVADKLPAPLGFQSPSVLVLEKFSSKHV